MLKFYMKDGVTLKSSDKYTLERFFGKAFEHFKNTYDTVMFSNQPLFAYIDDISGKKVFINMDNVLYIEEVEQ